MLGATANDQILWLASRQNHLTGRRGAAQPSPELGTILAASLRHKRENTQHVPLRFSLTLQHGEHARFGQCKHGEHARFGQCKPILKLIFRREYPSHAVSMTNDTNKRACHVALAMSFLKSAVVGVERRTREPAFVY
jgi:hypothetical protein